MLPDEGFAFRGHSNLEAVIGVLTSAKQFCMDFNKAGGILYMAMPGNEDVPILDPPLSVKQFFSL